MANKEHLEIIEKGVVAWNEWRQNNPDLKPDLSNSILSEYNLSGIDLSDAVLNWAHLGKANLSKANLSRADLSDTDLFEANLSGANLKRAEIYNSKIMQADLSKANLRKANLSRADLTWAILIEADLRWANLNDANLSASDLGKAKLSGADLNSATMVRTNLEKANLNGCRIYGISAWDLKLKETEQFDLIITPHGDHVITVDNLEVAQFVYLLLTNEKIRDVINTIGKKAVLILGSFNPPERKIILDAIRKELRRLNYVPILFDFEKPTDKDFTETILTLAGMCRFIIADITNPKSSPLELQATVPNYMIPFVPIIQEGEKPFSMFKDLANKYEWIMDTLVYDSVENLGDKNGECYY